MLLATVLLWALNFTVSKYILTHGFRPLSYSSIRYATAAAIFAAVTFPRERSLRVARGDLPLVVLCVGSLFLNQLCFIYALRFTTATTTALLFGTLPIFTALLSRVSRIERLSNRFWTAACLSFAGVAVVTAGSGGDLSGDVKGDVLAVLGAATWAAYSVAIAPLMRRYSPFRISALVLALGWIPLVLASIPQLLAQEFDFDWRVGLAFAFAVVGPLFLTNILWFTAIDRVGPSRASLFANLQPFLAAIFALILLSESMTLVQGFGGALIAIGIVLAGRPQRVAAVAAE